jgi:hypothetical protein
MRFQDQISNILVAKFENSVLIPTVIFPFKIVDWVGFEPTTLHLRSAHSTPELPALVSIMFFNRYKFRVVTPEIAICIRIRLQPSRYMDKSVTWLVTHDITFVGSRLYYDKC